MIYINRLRQGCAEMAQSSASLALFTSRPSPRPVNEHPSGVLCAGSNESPQLCHLSCVTSCAPSKAKQPPATPPGRAQLLCPSLKPRDKLSRSTPESQLPWLAQESGGRYRACCFLPRGVGTRTGLSQPPLTHRTPSSVGGSPQGWVAQNQGTPVAPLPPS